MKKSITIICLFCVISTFLVANNSFDSTTVGTRENINFILKKDDPVLAVWDSLVSSNLFQSYNWILDSTYFSSCPKDIDSNLTDTLLIKERLKKLDNETPFSLQFNNNVMAYLSFYLKKRYKLIAKVLGLAPYYFPIFEEYLDKYNLPLELKYLAVVESALNPTARSRAGAVGIWQFMYRTGKLYGLNINSYIDERMNVRKSTDAACRYLKFLYSIYNNWNLVLAAYNSGPGNVNKAIRRAGGVKDYWVISRFLPTETRGYVPAFISTIYIMNYAEEHNIYPLKPLIKLPISDTVYIKRNVDFKELSNFFCIPDTLLQILNPQYKLGFIPGANSPMPLNLPVKYVADFINNEKNLYAYLDWKEKEIKEKGKEKENNTPKYIVHKVKYGEVLGIIANKYNCTVSDIKHWNKLRSTRIYPGQKLTIYVDNNTVNQTNKQSKKEKKYKYYIVQPGDTLWDIAKKYDNITMNKLKKLNRNINYRRLKPGMKIIIGVEG